MLDKTQIGIKALDFYATWYMLINLFKTLKGKFHFLDLRLQPFINRD